MSGYSNEWGPLFDRQPEPKSVSRYDAPAFAGETFDEERDAKRLTRQLDRVRELMSDGNWRTLREISDATGGSEASVSARLRDMRKPQHGSLTVERRRRGNEASGLHEYRFAIEKEGK